MAASARPPRRRVRDGDLRQALAQIEQAFGPVTVLSTRPTPPDQRRRPSTAASANGHRTQSSGPQDAGSGADTELGSEWDGQFVLDLRVQVHAATPAVAADPPSTPRHADARAKGRR